MKQIHLLLVLFCFATLSFAQTVFINELHYDNVGTDENEGLEIAGPAGTDLTCYEIYLYNGSNGSVYDSLKLEGNLVEQNNGFGTHWVPIEPIQNGDNDAIALYDTCAQTVELFISYEGVLTATDGVAKEMTSVDIGVTEIDTEAGTSLQLIGSGMVYTDFIWAEASPSSPGSINTNQTFGEATAMPTFSVTPAELSLSENADSAVYTLQATNLTGMYKVTISTKNDSIAIEGEDYTLNNKELNLNGTMAANQTFDIVIHLINDEVEEENESVTFEIAVEGEDAIIANSTFTLIIQDDDAPLPPPETYSIYSIEDVHTENQNGVADSLDVTCELSGIVYGINLNDNGLLFTINDDIGGISVYNQNNNFDYEVTEGDEIKVQGKIGQFNGLTQIEADTLWKVSEGNALELPTEFTENGLYETLESQYVTFNELAMVDPTEWKGDGSSFNVHFTINNLISNPPILDTVVVRIDNNTSLASLSFEEITPGGYYRGFWYISGIGGQYDTSEPYTSGYQLFPFDLDDIIQINVPSAPTYLIDETIKVFPNPSTANLLEVRAETLVKGLRLYNTQGLLINENNNNTMDMKEITSGFYLLEVETNKGKTLKKIIR